MADMKDVAGLMFEATSKLKEATTEIEVNEAFSYMKKAYTIFLNLKPSSQQRLIKQCNKVAIMWMIIMIERRKY